MKSKFRLLAATFGLYCAATTFAQSPAPVAKASAPASVAVAPAPVAKASAASATKAVAVPAAKVNAKATTPAVAAPGGGNGKVWVNTKSKAYHCEGRAFYGKTKVGEYMTEVDAKAKGNHGKACAK